MKGHPYQGKVAIVTGSSRGIGKATAALLAAKGATLVLNGRNRERLKLAEQDIRPLARQCLAVCADISTPEGARHLINETLKAFDRIDILINNAGVSMRGNFSMLSPDVFPVVLETNVLGAIYPSLFALSHLRETRGSLLFISSLAGIRGLPGLSVYCASKMALRALTETLRIEEAANGIHVGLIYVPFTENEAGKETIGADGFPVPLGPRSGKGVTSIKEVAAAVEKNIRHRRYITILTPLGRLTYVLQTLVPGLVEWFILKNLKKFAERSG